MLDFAFKHLDEIKALHINTWYKERYKYFNYHPFYEVPKFEEGTWNEHGFVSLNNSGDVIGLIHYSINRSSEIVTGLSIINYTEDITFGKDVIQAIEDIFEKYNFRRLSFDVVVGNPIEKTYDRLILKYGGRIVGTERQKAKLYDGKYYDVKLYEVLKEDYIKMRYEHR